MNALSIEEPTMPPGTTHLPRKPTQPFVPVRSDDRTALYSHQELCALAASDPRSELDELSEPFRFKKYMTKPLAYFETEGRHRRGSGCAATNDLWG